MATTALVITALLPTEDPADYAKHHHAYQDIYRPSHSIAQAQVTELASIRWRLRRVPAFEAQLLSLEIHTLTTDPNLKPLLATLDRDNPNQILALAFSRLVESKVLPNLLNQEARLARRADKLERELESLIDRPTLPKTPEIENRKIEPISPIPSKPTPIRVLPQPGRNEPCPCSSGLKYKLCCLNKPGSLARAQ